MKKWTDLPIGDLVLYKNNQLIAMNKPAGLPVQGDRSGDKALLDLAEIYAQHPIQLIHRIDRPASGVVLFAKNPKAAAHLHNQFSAREVEKTYLAVVSELPSATEDRLIHYLQRLGRSNKTKVFEEPQPHAKEAVLSYRFLESIDRYHLLEIIPQTGRHHQIRAQLAAIGSPIKGDVKYGFRRRNRDRSIHLHAYRLDFSHPISGERQTVTAPLPDDPVWRAFKSV